MYANNMTTFPLLFMAHDILMKHLIVLTYRVSNNALHT